MEEGGVAEKSDFPLLAFIDFDPRARNCHAFSRRVLCDALGISQSISQSLDPVTVTVPYCNVLSHS